MTVTRNTIKTKTKKYINIKIKNKKQNTNQARSKSLWGFRAKAFRWVRVSLNLADSERPKRRPRNGGARYCSIGIICPLLAPASPLVVAGDEVVYFLDSQSQVEVYLFEDSNDN